MQQEQSTFQRGEAKQKSKATWAIKHEPNSSRRDLERSTAVAFFWGGGEDVAEQVESRGAPASVDDEVGHDMVLLGWDSTGRRRERRERVELFEV